MLVETILSRKLHTPCIFASFHDFHVCLACRCVVNATRLLSRVSYCNKFEAHIRIFIKCIVSISTLQLSCSKIQGTVSPLIVAPGA